MPSAIPVAKDLPEDLREGVMMDGIEIAYEEESKKGEEKNKTGEKRADTIDTYKGTAQDLGLLNMPSAGKTTCKPIAAPVKALTTLDKNRHSSRNRKGVSTYNVKALAGTAIHTPRKFNKDENGQVKAGPLKAENGSAGASVKLPASARGPSRLAKEKEPKADLPLPSSTTDPKTTKIGKKDNAASIASSAPTPGGVAPKVEKLGQSKATLMVPSGPLNPTTSEPSSSVRSKLAKIREPGILPITHPSSTAAPVAIAPNLAKHDHSTATPLPASRNALPNLVPKTIKPRAPVPIAPRVRLPPSVTSSASSDVPINITSYSEFMAAAKTGNLYMSTADSDASRFYIRNTASSIEPPPIPKKPSANPFHRIKLVVKPKPAADNGLIHLPTPNKSGALGDASKVSTSADKASKQSIATVSNSRHKGKASQNVPGGQKKTRVRNGKISGAKGIKRAAAADVDRAEPLTKKRKMQAITNSYRSEEVILYLTGTSPSSTHSLLTEEQVIANSAVLKHVLETKADPDNGYDSDDELCYNPGRSKDYRSWATGDVFLLPYLDCRAVFIIPLLKAMLQELDDELPNLGKWDKDNRTYLHALVNTPSDKIWELVQVWQGWVGSGEVKLGRCPFQRERMLKFARVMEMPVEFFRAVKKHEVDEKRFPTQHACEMWKNGLHPEQYVDREDKELKEYWSPIGGHIHEYYEKRGL